MPREIAVFGIYIPALLLVFLGAVLLAGLLDRLCAYAGLYRLVWHPALFRISLLVCVFGVLGLALLY